MAEKAKKVDMKIFHLCVVAIIILGFGHLPTFSTVTEYGMKALGCFIGIIYGWVFVDMLWTALAVFILVPFTGLIGSNGLIIAGFGNVVVMQVCFILMLFSALSNTAIPVKITNRLLSMKICQGKPWIFFGVLVFATWVISLLAGGIVAMIITFEILASLHKNYNVERYGKTSVFLFMGVLLGACLGQMCIPVKGMPLILFSMYKAMDPTAVLPMVPYMVFSTLLTLAICLVALMLFKFMFRADLSVLANIDTSAYNNKEVNAFTKKETLILADVVIVLLLMVLQSSLPASSITTFLGTFGMVGFCFVGMLALLLIKVDGEPLSTMPEMAKGMSWDTLLTVAAMQPVLAFISADEAGIKAMLSDICGPLVATMSPLVFVMFIVIICGLLTNFLNNAACCLMFFPLIMIYAPQLGLNPIGLVAILIVVSHIAYATPAASIYSLIAFGYTDWIKANSFMKYALITLIPMIVICSVIGYVLSLFCF